MRRRMLAVVFAVAVIALPGLAQNPSLSGTWKLNNAKSDFGPLPGPDSQTDVIEQSGSEVKLTVTSQSAEGNSKYTLPITTDGKDAAVTADAPYAHVGPITLTKLGGSWQGALLVVSESGNFQGTNFTDKRTMAVSADGNTLTVTQHISSGMGDFDRTLVFDKQGASAGGATTAAHAATGTKPNFTGTWRLNVAKSDFGAAPAPDSRVDTITHDEPSIKVVSDQKGDPAAANSYTSNFTTDGKQATFSVSGTDVKMTAVWEGKVLATTSKLSIQGTDLTIAARWMLSDDGKTLTIQAHISASFGDIDQKLTFEEQ